MFYRYLESRKPSFSVSLDSCNGKVRWNSLLKNQISSCQQVFCYNVNIKKPKCSLTCLAWNVTRNSASIKLWILQLNFIFICIKKYGLNVYQKQNAIKMNFFVKFKFSMLVDFLKLGLLGDANLYHTMKDQQLISQHMSKIGFFIFM